MVKTSKKNVKNQGNNGNNDTTVSESGIGDDFSEVDMTLQKGESPMRQYFRLKKLFETRYGNNTIIMYQVGKFFEVYDDHPKGAVQKVSQVLNIRQTHKDIPSVYMCGVPISSSENYIERLVSAGFTVIVIEQAGKKNEKQRTEDRKITDIRSPGTQLSLTNGDNPTLGKMGKLGNGNYIMAIYLDRARQVGRHEYNLLVGATVVDITTGRNYVYENYFQESNQGIFYEDIYRVMQLYSPREIIITYQNQHLRSLPFTCSTVCGSGNYDESSNKPNKERKTYSDTDFQKYILQQMDLGSVSCESESESNSENVTVSGCQNIYFRNEFLKKAWKKLEYQNQLLKKVFPKMKMDDIVETLGLDRAPTALISYIVALQFLYEHNPVNMKNLYKPVHLEQEKHLILNHNTLYQLNIIENHTLDSIGKVRSLFDVIRRTCTPMGARLLKQRLLSPIHDVKELNKRYELVDSTINLHKNKKLTFDIARSHLSQINDLELLHRRFVLGVIYPSQFVTLDLNYRVIQKVLALAGAHYCLDGDFGLKKSTISNFQHFIEEYNKTFLVEDMGNYDQFNINNSIFVKGKYPDVDKLQEEIDDIMLYIQRIRQGVGKMLYNDSAFQRTRDYQMLPTDVRKNIKNNVCTAYEHFTTFRTTEKAQENYIFITGQRSKFVKNICTACDSMCETKSKKTQNKEYIRQQNNYFWSSGIDTWDEEQNKGFNINQLTFVKQGSSGNQKITSTEIEKKLDRLHKLRTKMSNLCCAKYTEFINSLSNQYCFTLKKISQFIEQLDVAVSCAIVSYNYDYCRPSIVEHPDDDGKSYVDIKDMRHPIGERVNLDSEYVTNDIRLGIGNQDGILLFGVNGVGKSTCSKAIGLNICLAQMGMYVPARKFTFYPYRNIYARVNGMDNIFKAQSSFIVEMHDIRTIIHHADKNSLVVGDELGNTTENHSGLSIVATLIERLALRQSSFIFATHIHDLANLDLITRLDNVKFYHLKVKAEPGSKKIIYERKLAPGPGDSIYGLEIAQCVLDDDDFAKRAYQIRRQIEKEGEEIVSSKKSRYNSKLFVDSCKVCGITAEELNNNCNQRGTGAGYLEVHHIKFQCMLGKTADETESYVSGIVKNERKNLVVLCPEHHRAVHHGNLIIHGYTDSSEGRQLNYEFLKPQKNTIKNKKKNDNISKITQEVESNDIGEVSEICEVDGGGAVAQLPSEAYKLVSDFASKKSKLSRTTVLKTLKIKYDIALSMIQFKQIVSQISV